MARKQPITTADPMERTIAVALVPVVSGADVEVQVGASPNLWLHGITDASGYVAWQWTDQLGDSAIRVRAAGYQDYLVSCHWKTLSDPDVGEPPLNHQLTVGGELPPLVPFAPPVVPGVESGPLTIARPTIRDDTGACWQWRGFTDFLLFYRFLTGVDIQPFLDERIGLGANVLRVFSMVGWTECQPPFYPEHFVGYYDKLAAFADRLAACGVRFELTVFADAQIVMPDAADREAHLRDCLDALRSKWNKIVEVANEPFKNLPGGDEEAIHLAVMAQQYDPTCLIASGEYSSWPPALTASYGTTHCDRSEDWPRKCKDLKDRCDESQQTPWIGDEPMGAAEVSEPGRRDANPDNHAWYASGAQMFSPGATYHCEDGIHSRTPIGPNQTACAKRFFEALRWTPKEALTWPYQRGDMGSEAGVGNMPILHDDALEARSYCKSDGGRSWCIQIQTSREHATPRDGWRVVSEPWKGFVYLEKP
jgi:hypothetical protein